MWAYLPWHFCDGLHLNIKRLNLSMVFSVLHSKLPEIGSSFPVIDTWCRKWLTKKSHTSFWFVIFKYKSAHWVTYQKRFPISPFPTLKRWKSGFPRRITHALLFSTYVRVSNRFFQPWTMGTTTVLRKY